MIEKNHIRLTQTESRSDDMYVFTAKYMITTQHKIGKNLLAELKGNTIKDIDIEKEIERLCIKELYNNVYGDLSRDIIELLCITENLCNLIPSFHDSYKEIILEHFEKMNHKLKLMAGD